MQFLFLLKVDPDMNLFNLLVVLEFLPTSLSEELKINPKLNLKRLFHPWEEN